MKQNVQADGRAALAQLRDAVDACLEIGLESLDRDGLLELTRELETQTRRLPAVQHRLVAELDSRGVGREVGAVSTAGLLRQLLRLSVREATARVRAAADLGPRRGLTGEVLEPVFPAVAAQAAGVISPAHAGSSPARSTRCRTWWRPTTGSRCRRS